MSVYSGLSITNSPLVTRRRDRPTPEETQLVVVLASFFSHKLTKGYGNPAGRVVKSVNDIAIKSLRHLVEVLRDAQDDYIIIEFAGYGAAPLVFSRKEMIAATEEVLTDNGIRAQGSPALMEF